MPFRTTKKQGLGIGLYQCRQVMEAHGGSIEVSSVEGEGSTFTLCFPDTADSESGKC
jgi:signal transduction histidine kinase